MVINSRNTVENGFFGCQGRIGGKFRPGYGESLRQDEQSGRLFMQNKPNFGKGQMNTNSFLTKDYENKSTFRGKQNKAKQSQSLFFTAEKAELIEPLLFEDLCQCNWIKHNYLAMAIFPLTSSTERDYNVIFCAMSCLQRRPNERVWK